MYEKFFKRILDIVFALFAIIVFFLPLSIVSLLVLLDVGRPIVFRQRRIGKDNKEFYLYKFRTMNNETNADNILLPDSERLTKLGRFLRKTSIDELPSLINILNGNMSIVGPRPLPVRYLKRYTVEQLRRHEVLPGLTNISAISGRNLLSWEDKFKMDVWYVDNVSFLTDIKVIFATLVIVLNHKGAVAGDGDVRSEFIGTMSVDEAMTAGGTDYIKLVGAENDKVH